MDWAEIVSIVLTIAAVLFGEKWRRARKTAREIAEALVQTGSGFFDIVTAVEDNEITIQEEQKLAEAWRLTLSEWQDVITAARNLARK